MSLVAPTATIRPPLIENASARGIGGRRKRRRGERVRVAERGAGQRTGGARRRESQKLSPAPTVTHPASSVRVAAPPPLESRPTDRRREDTPATARSHPCTAWPSR